jgi:hypothetical protein
MINGTAVTSTNFNIAAGTRVYLYYNGTNYEVISAEAVAGGTYAGGLSYFGTTAGSAGQFDSSTTNPSGTVRLNYNGYLYASSLYASNTLHIGTGTQQF